MPDEGWTNVGVPDSLVARVDEFKEKHEGVYRSRASVVAEAVRDFLERKEAGGDAAFLVGLLAVLPEADVRRARDLFAHGKHSDAYKLIAQMLRDLEGRARPPAPEATRALPRARPVRDGEGRK